MKIWTSLAQKAVKELSSHAMDLVYVEAISIVLYLWSVYGMPLII